MYFLEEETIVKKITKIEQHETGPDIDKIRSEYDKGSGGKLATLNWVVKYPNVVKVVYI